MRRRLQPFTFLVLFFLACPDAASADPAGPVEIAVTLPGAAATTNARTLEAVVTFRAEGNIQQIDVLVNGEVAQSRPNPPNIKSASLTVPLDLSGYGDQLLTISAVAYQGNRRAGVSTTSPPVHVLLDRTPPVVRIMAPAEGLVSLNDGNIGLAFSYLDNLSGVRDDALNVTLDGDDVTSLLAASSGHANFAPDAPLAAGTHTYRARATDAAGNTSEPASASFDVVHADGAARIGRAGGTLAIVTGPFAGGTVVIPAGTLEHPRIFTGRAVQNPVDPLNTQPVLDVAPGNFLFDRPVTVALPTRSTGFESFLHAMPGDDWTSMETTDCGAGLMCAPVRGLGYFQVFEWELCRPDGDCLPLSQFQAPAPATADPPVLLIHGQSLCNVGGRDYWAAMPQLLAGEGLSVWRLRYDTRGRIADVAPAVGAAIGRVRQATGTDSVTLVAHSEGGLVAREYLQRPGTDTQSVYRLITVGTPHLGTLYGFAGLCPGIGDMRPGSPFLDALNGSSEPAGNLAAAEHDYVFLVGTNIVGFDPPLPFTPPVCLALPTDGVVSVDSATAEGIASYDEAVREVFQGYPHVSLFFMDSAACGITERAQASPEDAEHAIYQAVLRWARRAPALEIMYFSGEELKRVNPTTGEEMASYHVGEISYFSVSPDRRKILLARGGYGGSVQILDTETRVVEFVLSAPWVSTISFLPGKSDEFVYNDHSGWLWRHDLTAATTSPWQMADTAGIFGKNTYRGGIDWSGPGTRIIAAIGMAYTGGDGVFVGDACDDSAGHHICNLAPLANPAGFGSSWASIATWPQLSKDGRYAYYLERLNWASHTVWKHDIRTGHRTPLLERPDSANSSYASLSLVDDTYLTVDAYESGISKVYICDVRGNTPCTTGNLPDVRFWSARGIRW